MAQIHQYGSSYVALNPPNEWMNSTVDSTVNDSDSEASVNTNIYTFSGAAAQFLFQWRTDFGVHNGVPYRQVYISEKDPTQQYIIFDGYIDISAEEAFINSQVNPMIYLAPIVRTKNSPSVIDQMAVLTQGVLLSKNAISSSDFVDIPVIIESKKNIRERGVEIAAFGVQVVTSLSQIVSNLLGALANILGLGIVVGVIELVVVIANAVMVINRLIDQGVKLKNLFFPKVVYYKGFNIGNMIRKAFAYKGYTVEFGELEGYFANSYLMPSQNDFDGFPAMGFPATAPNTGICKPQDYGYTIMELIEAMTMKLNLRRDVIGSVVHLKRRSDSFWTASPSYTAPNVLIKSTDAYSNGLYKDDTERVKATFVLNYTYDSTDCHTLTEKSGDSVEVHRDLINELDPQMNTLKGLDERVIPWALCVRKKPFDNLFELFSGILSDDFDPLLQQIKDRITEYIADLNSSGVDPGMLNTLLSSVGISAILENRTGCLKIDDNTYAIPKFCYLTETGHGLRIPENFKNYCGAPALYNSNYLSDSPAIQNSFLGQYRLVKDLRLPWSYENFQTTQLNPFFLIQGNNAKFNNIAWNEPKHEAVTNLEIQEPFDTNITEAII